QTAGLIELSFVMAFANMCFIGDEQISAKSVQRFSFVELPIDLTPEFFTAKILQNEVCFDQATIIDEERADRLDRQVIRPDHQPSLLAGRRIERTLDFHIVL